MKRLTLTLSIAVSLPRKAVRTYVFSDGTIVPEGAIISATQSATQLDEAYYEHAEVFDGFRFSKLREKAANQEKQDILEETEQNLEDDWKYRYTGTGIGFLAFGGGRHVWYVSQPFSEVRSLIMSMTALVAFSPRLH